MEKINKWKIEKELQRELAIAYVRSYCEENNLSLEKLISEKFVLSYNECGFAHPSEIEVNGLLNDKDTVPKVTLMIKYENKELKIEETEYTRKYLSLE